MFAYELRGCCGFECSCSHLDKYCCVKSVPVRRFSGPYFPKFGLNRKIYKGYLRMQSECWKLRTRKNPNTVTSHAMYLSMNVVLVLLRLPSGKLGSALFFYKHTGKLGWSSICLWFSQFEPEIMLDSMLNFKTHFMVWYCVWYEHCNGLF